MALVVYELEPQLIELIAPLPQHIYRILGYVHRVEQISTFLPYPYWRRRRDSEVDDGKDEKDCRDNVVSMHFLLDVLVALLIEY